MTLALVINYRKGVFMKKSLFSKLLSGVMSLGVLSGNNLMPNRVCAMENLDDESHGEEECSCSQSGYC